MSRYIKTYLNELSGLVRKIPEETRILLPDHIVANQEILVYITTKTGIAVDYLGLSTRTEIRFQGSDRSFDDLIFPPTEFDAPYDQGILKLRPLNKSASDEPTTTLKLMGSMRGIVLFKVTGGGHLFAYDDLASSYGRYTIFNLYVQREYANRSLRSRYVRYAELYPDKKEMFTSAKAVANARKDLYDHLEFVTKPDFGPVVQKYVKIGDAIHQLKESSVVVLGKDTPPELDLLRRIRDELQTMDYNAFLVKEERDIPGQSPEEKVKLLTLMSKFAVMEDSTASGHIAEFEYCKNNRVPLILLRKKKKGSTWMIGDAELVDMNFIRTFEYSEDDLHAVLTKATKWAEDFVHRRAEVYEQYLPWRKTPKKGKTKW